jgi:hypothetical protein
MVVGAVIWVVAGTAIFASSSLSNEEILDNLFNSVAIFRIFGLFDTNMASSEAGTEDRTPLKLSKLSKLSEFLFIVDDTWIVGVKDDGDAGDDGDDGDGDCERDRVREIYSRSWTILII